MAHLLAVAVWIVVCLAVAGHHARKARQAHREGNELKRIAERMMREQERGL